MRESSDEELVVLARQGSRAAFDEIFDRYKRRILNFVYHMLHDKETAEDVTQEVFVKVYMNLENYDPAKGKISSWIYTIAGNTAKNVLRDKKHKQDTSLDNIIFDEEKEIRLGDVISDEKYRPDSALEDKELQSQIQAVLDSMDVKYKEVITLCDIEGVSYEEAAKIMGISKGSVASRLYRARAIFIKKLNINLESKEK